MSKNSGTNVADFLYLNVYPNEFKEICKSLNPSQCEEFSNKSTFMTSSTLMKEDMNRQCFEELEKKNKLSKDGKLTKFIKLYTNGLVVFED